MFGFLKNLFGGIFSFLGGLLGFKKSEYVLEFESAPSAAPAAKTQPAKPAATAPAQATQPAAIAQPAKATAPAPTPAKTSQPAAPAPSPKPEPAKAPDRVGGFAASYSLPTVTSTRRRPGANMNSFLDMARKVNPSR